MTKGEVGLVLAKCAAFDQRTVGEADGEAWLEVIGDLDAAEALAAVTGWYREHRERIMPSDIRQAVTGDTGDGANVMEPPWERHPERRWWGDPA